MNEIKTRFLQLVQDLFASPTRMILTILGIAWGTAAIAAMLSFGEGLRISFGEAIASNAKDLLIVFPGQSSLKSHRRRANQKITFTSRDISLLHKALPKLILSPNYSTSSVTISYGDKTYSGPVNGVAPSMQRIQQLKIVPGGRFINPLDMQGRRRVIVIGEQVAEALFKDQGAALGKMIRIANQAFTVVGVVQAKPNQMVMINGSDSMQSWIPSSTYLLLSGQDKMPILLGNTAGVADVQGIVTRLLAFLHHYNPKDKGVLNYFDTKSFSEKTQTFFINMEIFLGIMGALTLTVAGFGVANIMYISVKSATQEIGIRIALGAKSYQILLHYLGEALLATLLGGLLGLVMVLGLNHLVSLLPIAKNFLMLPGRFHPILSWQVFSVIILILLTIGLVAGIFPARRAANVDPIEALRDD